MSYRQALKTLVSIFTIGVLLSACAGGSPAAPTASATAEPTRLTVQLSWVHDVEFVGFYEAAQSGDYAAADLDVTLAPGGYDASGNLIEPIKEVTSGRAQFGVSDSGVLLEAREGGAPVVAIATIYQRSPIAFVSLAEKNITRPQDLVGAKVAIDPATTGVVYQALLASQGIDPASVNLEDRTDFTAAPIISGKVDVLDGWVTNEVVSLEEQGLAYNTILASDYGIEIYPDVIFTTEDMIKNQPEVVAAFLKATIAGDKKSIENPDGAAALVVKYDSTLKADEIKLKMQASLPLLNPAGSNPGMMTDAAWKSTKDILVEQDLLQSTFDVSKAYTLDFLNTIYGSN